MEYLVPILLGMAIVWLWPRLREGLRRALSSDSAGAQPGSAPQMSPAAVTSSTNAEMAGAPTPTIAPSQSESLMSRLRELFALIDAEINTSAPARELAADSRFVEARRLLADDSVPLDAVSEYAIGANWFFSCAALSALCDRGDRDEALDTIVPFFDALTPWGMYFALKLFLAADPRPPVGTPLSNVAEWWRDNMFVVTTFREHFDDRSRLGDEARFGSALDGTSQEKLNLIKSFLARLSHPLADSLIENLETVRMRNVDRAFLTSFGTFWHRSSADLLIEPDIWKDELAETETGNARTASALVAREWGSARRQDGVSASPRAAA